ncbi:hypothetical protein D1164_11000 [Mariniphaga sediminis]|uniref:Uncharacterized protein n=1 Tax=Mariniphaga sediminis TaxID=1628158 RepID=A0A399D0Z9_9BACT|nr:hypothetical protein [Mariniphaga sediminis]RIH65106.1 hypothetical protein D1164_11000 [Mariniphaga sediminis]
MSITVDNINYKIIIASDIVRDGLGIELWDNDRNEIVAEIFRNDNLKKIQISTFRTDLPLEILEKLINEFDKEIGRNFQCE